MIRCLLTWKKVGKNDIKEKMEKGASRAPMKVKLIVFKGKYRFLILTIIALLLPSLVIASVIISNTYPISIGQEPPLVYLTTGPNYQNYNNSGQFQATVNGVPPNIWSGTTIYINWTILYLLSNGKLLFVLQINNTLNTAVSLWINGSLPGSIIGSITMYYKNSPNGNLGTQWVSGQKIVINKNKNLYLSFVVPWYSSGNGSLTFTYVLASGVIVTYNYSVSANPFQIFSKKI